MGFASGSYAAQDIWKAVKKYVPPKHQQKVAKIIVDEFENLDADDWSYEPGDVYAVAYPERCVEEE